MVSPRPSARRGQCCSWQSPPRKRACWVRVLRHPSAVPAGKDRGGDQHGWHGAVRSVARFRHLRRRALRAAGPAEGRGQGLGYPHTPDPKPEAGLFFRSDHFRSPSVACRHCRGRPARTGWTVAWLRARRPRKTTPPSATTSRATNGSRTGCSPVPPATWKCCTRWATSWPTPCLAELEQGRVVPRRTRRQRRPAQIRECGARAPPAWQRRAMPGVALKASIPAFGPFVAARACPAGRLCSAHPLPPRRRRVRQPFSPVTSSAGLGCGAVRRRHGLERHLQWHERWPGLDFRPAGDVPDHFRAGQCHHPYPPGLAGGRSPGCHHRPGASAARSNCRWTPATRSR